MNVLDSVVFLLVGLAAVAVAAEAIYRGRIRYAPTRSRPRLEVQRSREPVRFWCMASLVGGIGVACIAAGFWRLARPG